MYSSTRPNYVEGSSYGFPLFLSCISTYCHGWQQFINVHRVSCLFPEHPQQFSYCFIIVLTVRMNKEWSERLEDSQQCIGLLQSTGGRYFFAPSRGLVASRRLGDESPRSHVEKSASKITVKCTKKTLCSGPRTAQVPPSTYLCGNNLIYETQMDPLVGGMQQTYSF